ncbi:MAG: hypothetical protein AAF430_14125 [Myxococcota bacterium]
MGDDLRALEPIMHRAVTEPDGFRCEREGTGHRLELWGRLRPEWAGNLGLQLFAARVQVVVGDAIRTPPGPWAASFLLQTADARAPLRHDFLAMARSAPHLPSAVPDPVVSISAQLSHDAPGDVYARVEGKDSIGLVAHVLAHFARFGLQPRRFAIRTRDDQVDDWFWLEPLATPSSGVDSIENLARDWRTDPVQ